MATVLNRSTYSQRVLRREPTDAERAMHREALEDLGLEDDEGRLVPVLISTAARARDGHVIHLDGWRFDNYRTNPLILWSHDRNEPAIGRGPLVEIDPEQDGVRSLSQFTPREVNPFGAMIGEMVARGYLHKASIGWDTIRHERTTDPDVLAEYPHALEILEAELLEYSPVNVEADQGAAFGRSLAHARVDGVDTNPAQEWAERMLDTSAGIWIPRPTLERVALTHGVQRTHFDLGVAPEDPMKNQIELFLERRAQHMAEGKSRMDAEAQAIEDVMALRMPPEEEAEPVAAEEPREDEPIDEVRPDPDKAALFVEGLKQLIADYEAAGGEAADDGDDMAEEIGREAAAEAVRRFRVA